MKKFCKFLLGTLSLATLACGAYYFCKKYICNESKEDFDDLDDDFDEYEADEAISSPSETREYVSINITSEPSTDVAEEDIEQTSEAMDVEEDNE